MRRRRVNGIGAGAHGRGPGGGRQPRTGAARRREVRGSGACRRPPLPRRRPPRRRTPPSASPPPACRRWPRASTRRGERERMEVEQPFTGGTLGSVPRCTPEDVGAALARARAAQAAWARTSFAERSRVLLRFHDLVLARQDEMLDLLQLESGKARRHAFEEVLDVAIVARYYANTAEKHLQDAPPARRAPAAHRRLRAPPPARRGRRHRAVELPAHAERQRRDARARRRQRRGHQARQPDAVQRAVGRRAARGGGAAAPGSSRSSPARAPSSARTSSRAPTT